MGWSGCGLTEQVGFVVKQSEGGSAGGGRLET